MSFYFQFARNIRACHLRVQYAHVRANCVRARTHIKEYFVRAISQKTLTLNARTIRACTRAYCTRKYSYAYARKSV